MSKNDDDAVAKVMAVILAIPVSVVARAWVLTVMWGWYFTPFGAPEIGMAHAAGISLTVGYLTKHGASEKDTSVTEAMTTALAGPLVVLLFGWMIHAFM